ncbi:hypothetical protein R1sor_010838 [Riccia sorocarpa]|uniref:Short-chain dehydrogenase/reductase n=1 Tax=Riccia sorocarpa TaxID=122646 RepID=A0ABD3I2U7_9MARC
MGQSASTLLRGNLSAVGLGSSLTADQVTEGIDLSQHTAIVTGGTSGIGKETARVLAKRGAHVIIAGRKMDVAEDVKRVILQESPSANVDMMQLDLTSVESVRSFVRDYESKNYPLSILVNNAGTFDTEFHSTPMGIERMFATHVVGPFLLTQLLLERMKQTAKDTGIEGRVVVTGSDAHRITSVLPQGVDFDSLKDPSRFSALKNYGQSKVAAILLTEEFGKKLKAENANVTANVGHPGTVTTQLGRTFIDQAIPGPNKLTDKLYQLGKPALKKPEEGAATITFVATRPEVQGVYGRYYSDCTVIEPNRYASNPELGKKVWQYCEDVVGAGVGA